jgi:hypothetical protein
MFRTWEGRQGSTGLRVVGDRYDNYPATDKTGLYATVPMTALV